MAKPGTYAAPNKVISVDPLQPFLYFDFSEAGFSDSKQSDKRDQVHQWVQKLTDDVVRDWKVLDYKTGYQSYRYGLRLDTTDAASSGHPVGTQLLRSIEVL